MDEIVFPLRLLGIRLLKNVAFHLPGLGIEAVQAGAFVAKAASAHPQDRPAPRQLLLILEDHAGVIAAEAVGVIGIVGVVSEAAGLAVEQVEPAAHRGDPQATARVLEDVGDQVVAEAIRAIGVMAIANEDAGARVVAVETAAPGADPELALGVFKEAEDRIVAEGRRIFGVIFEYGEAVAIVAVQAVLGADPQEAAFILQETQHRVLGEAVFEGEALEAQGSIEGNGERFFGWLGWRSQTIVKAEKAGKQAHNQEEVKGIQVPVIHKHAGNYKADFNVISTRNEEKSLEVRHQEAPAGKK